jgi:hypothetical protein
MDLCWLRWKFKLFPLTCRNFGSIQIFLKFGRDMQRYLLNK